MSLGTAWLTRSRPQPSVRSAVSASFARVHSGRQIMQKPLARGLLLAVVGLGGPGCSGVATGLVADALSGSGSSYASDNDPELIEASAPFGLKTMETVLVSKPEHRGLLTALTSGYVQYAYGFIYEKAHVIEPKDYKASEVLKKRAQNLFLRARDYGMRGLAVEHDDFAARLRADPDATLAETDVDDVALLYWTAASWSLAISSGGLEPRLVVDLPLAGKMVERALTLDEDWSDGALHDFMVSYETSRPGGDLAAARKHFDRALELNGGRRAGTYLGYAEGVAVQQQDVKLFRSLIDKALAVDVDSHPDDRLVNVIMQRRARRLLARIDDLFLDAEEDGQEESP